jgi:hypothetical protein
LTPGLRGQPDALGAFAELLLQCAIVNLANLANAPNSANTNIRSKAREV